MRTIKLTGANGRELVRIDFDGQLAGDGHLIGHLTGPRIQSAPHVDDATVHNALLLALVTCVARHHEDGAEVTIPVPGVAGPMFGYP